MQKSNKAQQFKGSNGSGKALQPALGRPKANVRAVRRVDGGGVVSVPLKTGPMLSSDIRFTNREFVGNLSGNSASFALLGLSAAVPGYDLNPANKLLFPWLSGIAKSYEKYRFESLSLEVVSRNPATASGVVYVAFDYDWDDNPASSATEMMVNRGAVSADVWTPTLMHVDCQRLNQGVPWRYVETLSRTGDSQRLSYGGFFQLGIAGTVATVSFDMYVRYTVCLTLPAIHEVDNAGTLVNLTGFTVGVGSSAPFTGLPVVRGLPKATIGQDGVPTLGTYSTGPCYVVPQSAGGTVTVAADLATAGAPPNSFAADTAVDVQGYDALGALVRGSIGSFFGTNTYQGPRDIAEWAVNGKDGKASSSFSLAALRKLYPTLRYLLPIVYSAAGRVLNGYTVSTRFSEL